MTTSNSNSRETISTCAAAALTALPTCPLGGTNAAVVRRLSVGNAIRDPGDATGSADTAATAATASALGVGRLAAAAAITVTVDYVDGR